MSNAEVDVFSFPSFNPRSSSSTRHLLLVPPLLLPLGRHSAAWAFAGSGIGFGTLPAYRKAAAMPQSPVTPDIHKPLDIHADLTAQVSLNLVVLVDDLSYFGNFFLG
jgi:hypothetical protein